MSEPRRIDDRRTEKEHYEARRRLWWSSRRPKNASERKLVNEKGRKDTGFTTEPEDGFYGHYMPSHFKKTNQIRTYGKS